MYLSLEMTVKEACLVWINVQGDVTKLIIQRSQTKIEKAFPVTGYGNFLFLRKQIPGSRNHEEGIQRLLGLSLP